MTEIVLVGLAAVACAAFGVTLIWARKLAKELKALTTRRGGTPSGGAPVGRGSSSASAPGETRASVAESAVVAPEESEAAKFARVMAQRISANSALDYARSRLMWVEIHSDIDAETVGWVGEEKSFGIIKKTALLYEDVKKGDAIRALVSSTPWWHTLESPDPNSVRRVGERIRAQRAIEFERNRRFNSWHDHLRPGDLVVARVPFGPHGRRLVSDLTGKARPAVFVRFLDDYLVVRGIFTAGKYEERERESPRLVDPKRALKKKSVVGIHEQELDVTAVKKKIGRLEPVDLSRLGLHDDPTGSMAQSDSRAERISRFLLEGGAVSNSSSYSELLVCVIREMRRDAELQVEFRSAGVFLSEVGAVVASLCRELDLERESAFGRRVRAVLEDNPDIGLMLIDAQLGTERLVFSAPSIGHTPSRSQSDDVQDPEAPSGGPGGTVEEIPVNWRPLDYEPPSLIIFDQLWLFQALDGRRLDFDVIAESLREGGNAKILWVGPAVTVGLVSLQNAIRQRGWTVVGAEARDGDVDLAAAGAEEFAGQPVTVVSGGADMLDAIESVAERVFVIDEIRPFLQ
jgi:hypothetical protein